MDNQIYLSTVITIFSLSYLYGFYMKNKKVIDKIKYGKILFVISAIMVLLVGIIIVLKLFNSYTIFYILPSFVVSLWFSYQFYKIKNSLFDYIYLMVIIIFSIVIYYNLYWNNIVEWLRNILYIKKQRKLKIMIESRADLYGSIKYDDNVEKELGIAVDAIEQNCNA